MTFWNDIFSQIDNGPSLGPQYMEGAIGGSPTATEQQGQEFSIVGGTWNDPLAVLGYQPGVIDWHRNTGGPYIAGEYRAPGNPEFDRERSSDTVRFWQGVPWNRPGDPPPEFVPAASRPSFPEFGRHEFRHRGLDNLEALAREYNVPFDRAARPVLNFPFEGSERLNVYEDRRTGSVTPYQGMTFDPRSVQFTEELMAHLRGVADQINAARVQRMHATGARWGQLP